MVDKRNRKHTGQPNLCICAYNFKGTCMWIPGICYKDMLLDGRKQPKKGGSDDGVANSA